MRLFADIFSAEENAVGIIAHAMIGFKPRFDIDILRSFFIIGVPNRSTRPFADSQDGAWLRREFGKFI